MKRISLHIALLFTVSVFLLTPFLNAQKAGDALIFEQWNAQTHLVAMSPPAGTKTTVLTLNGYPTVDGLAIATANDGCIFAEYSISSSRVNILSFKPGRGATTLAVMPASFYRLPTLDVDQGGDVLILNHLGPDRGLYRMPPGGGPLTTIAHVKTGARFATPYCMAEDVATGDIVVPDLNGLIHRIRLNGKITTVQYSLPVNFPPNPVGNLHVDHSTGLMFLAVGFHLLGVDPATGATVTRFGITSSFLTNFMGIDGDPILGGYYVHAVNIRFPAIGILRFDPVKNTLTTFASFSNPTLGNVVTWESRMLSGLARPVRGKAYPIALTIPPEAGKPYFAAAGLGTLLGIPAGKSRRIPLDPDVLFYLSIRTPSLFSGFQGVLDAQGKASLTVNILASPQLVGLRFFVVAVTYDTQGIRIITDPLGVTIW